jgi:hypothetical protein
MVYPLLDAKWNLENPVEIKAKVSCVNFLIAWAYSDPQSFSNTLSNLNVDAESFQEMSAHFTCHLLMQLSSSVYFIILSLKYSDVTKKNFALL